MDDTMSPIEHKQEALKALDHLVAKLVSPEPLSGYERFLLRGSAEYAREQVQAIAVLTRVRGPRAIGMPVEEAARPGHAEGASQPAAAPLPGGDTVSAPAKAAEGAGKKTTKGGPVPAPDETVL